MIRVALPAIVAGLFCTLAAQARSAELVLAENGQSAYRIVVAQDASPSVKHGAEELQMFLGQISGAKLPIISDQQPQGPKEIILGDNAHLRKLGVAIDFAALGKEGYVLRTVGDTLLIAGGPVRGAMYGVYGLLEDHLGCRWFAPGVSRIPKSARLAIGPLDERQIPLLESREPYVADFVRDADWNARNRMNSANAWLDEGHGGKVKFGDGFFVHTFARLVPPEKYFATHPEYFTLTGGKRIKDGQLCCTNPDVIRLCTEEIRKAMRAQPDATVFSVSQNDCGGDCQCPRCQEVAKREDSAGAPVLQMVNRIAEAVEKEFPDKIVETLAYQWTRHPPKSLHPRPNVVVRLCSIECCFSHPLATCPSPLNQAFRKDIESWAKVAPRLWVWDYTTDFAHFLLPFPNHMVIGPNIRFYAEHNVKGIFEEDTNTTTESEMWALDAYLMAKCLWNPNCDPDRAINEFLAGYYDKAGVPIRGYLDLLDSHVNAHQFHVGIYTNPDAPFLTDELLTKADALWQQAEELAAGQPDVLRRVKLSRMSPDYAIVERARLQAQKKLPASPALLKLATARYRPFIETMKSSSLSGLAEGQSVDKEVYARDLAKALGLSSDK
jgi:hypothetical protein